MISIVGCHTCHNTSYVTGSNKYLSSVIAIIFCLLRTLWILTTYPGDVSIHRATTPIWFSCYNTAYCHQSREVFSVGIDRSLWCLRRVRTASLLHFCTYTTVHTVQQTDSHDYHARNAIDEEIFRDCSFRRRLAVLCTRRGCEVRVESVSIVVPRLGATAHAELYACMYYCMCAFCS